jgi:hypothetical protein
MSESAEPEKGATPMRLVPVAVLLVLCALPIDGARAHGHTRTPIADRFEYGFLNANVTVRQNGERRRVKIVSQVVGACFAETPKSKLVESARWDLNQELSNRFGMNYEVTYVFFQHHSSRERAEEQREKALRDPDFDIHVGFVSTLGSVYYSKCR